MNEGPTPGQRYRVRAAPQVDREGTGAVEEEEKIWRALGLLYEMHDHAAQCERERAQRHLAELIARRIERLDELRAVRT